MQDPSTSVRDRKRRPPVCLLPFLVRRAAVPPQPRTGHLGTGLIARASSSAPQRRVTPRDSATQVPSASDPCFYDTNTAKAFESSHAGRSDQASEHDHLKGHSLQPNIAASETLEEAALASIGAPGPGMNSRCASQYRAALMNSIASARTWRSAFEPPTGVVPGKGQPW